MIKATALTATGVYRTEATPHGVSITRRNEAGQYEHMALIDYPDMLRKLEAGDFDGVRDMPDILRAMADGAALGYHAPTAEQELIVWRHRVALTFINEQMRENGAVEVENGRGGTDSGVIYCGQYGCMAVYPAPERFAMANNIESALIERYGREQGTRNAVLMYQAMLEGGGLSDMGRELLADLHDGFIRMLRDEGLPPEPVAH
ncbi:hypothetical protein [Erwinia amylovora]|uniref:hypothetical protein n=1 Tax=Erwinia amylovora TaxID=552 RepID=UPI000C06D0E3|nr:hypothetical protein [Erwinia amylovora]